MAFSIAFSNSTFSPLSSSSSSPYCVRRHLHSLRPHLLIRALSESEAASVAETKADGSSNTQPPAPASTATASPKIPQKPVFSMKKGQIVRVDKDKYLNSVNYLSVDHPPYYKGLDYIYEDRGEVLDLRNFDTGEYALVAWVGIPTAPAWLPTDMLIKSDKLDYERM